MEMSKRGLREIRFYESAEPRVYPDSSAKLTIGIGHLLTKEELRTGILKIGKKTYNWKTCSLSNEEMDELLGIDLDKIEGPLSSMFLWDGTFGTVLKQHQFDALICLIFNIGMGAFKSSTLLRRLEQKDIDGAMEAWTWWNKETKRGVKVVSNGLVTRRGREIKLFTTGVYKE